MLIPKQYGAGFIDFVIDHPVAKTICEEFVTALTAAVKDHPALFSLCLTNEPLYTMSGRDRYSRPLYVEFLKERHGTVETLNALYGTDYPDFDSAAEPPLARPETGTDLQRAHFDWCDFNRDHFHDWHDWLNALVKADAPNVLTHSKTVTIIYAQWDCWHGYDPERMCRITDIAGNDEVLFYGTARHGELGDYAFDWIPQAMGHDFQYSVRGQPVFDSEHHIIADNSTDAVPAQHTRIGLWQGALHHLGASTIWVWNEPGTPGKQWGLKGSIYLRPANQYAAARTMFDLNRLATEVSTVAAAKPRVALLHTIPALYWQDDFSAARRDAYAALTCLGEPVAFVTERQLAAGDLRDYAWIIVPHAMAVRQSTVEGLQRYADSGARLMFYGDSNLTRDEYWRPREVPAAFADAIRIPVQDSAQLLSSRLLETFAANGLSRIDLRTATTGEPAWGVEYRVVPYGESAALVSLVNVLNHAVSVELDLAGKAIDLISGDRRELGRIALSPMECLLLEVR